MKKMKTKKKLLFIFIPILIALIVVSVIVKNYKDKQNDNILNENSTNENVDFTYAKIYLLDKDNVLLPLTIKCEEYENPGELYHYLFSCLKEDANYENFKGYIPSSCKVNQIEIKDDIVTFDLDENFNKYEAKNELKILEGLTWTFTQFENVDKLELKINGQKLKNMEINKTPLNNYLTKDNIGINNFLLTSTLFQQGEKVLSYYEKEIDDKFYYVPVTHYVSNKNNLKAYDLTISTLFKKPDPLSNLQVARCISETEMVSNSVVTDNVLYVSLTEDILFDELTVSKDVYELLKLSTQLLSDIKDVSFLIELEQYQVNGLKENEEVQVADIVFNKYYI